jgi:hypothetical protein
MLRERNRLLGRVSDSAAIRSRLVLKLKRRPYISMEASQSETESAGIIAEEPRISEFFVIASAAKQSTSQRVRKWIASSLRSSQ